MPSLKPLEPGAMFWAGRDSVAGIRALGVRCGQLGVGNGVELSGAAAARWKAELARERFTLVTVFAAFEGESYADIPTVRRTVGFIPRETREERERRTMEVSDFTAGLGVRSIACHIGFIPENRSNADRIAVRDMVRRVCEHAAGHRQTFALETGQETAQGLLHFIEDVSRPNLRINFDPANMILYGTGEPIPALRTLAPLVASVHCKDGDWPPERPRGALGVERRLGEGSVGIARFVRTLAEIGFRGPLNVEREAEDPEERLRDIRKAVQLLRLVARGVGG